MKAPVTLQERGRQAEAAGDHETALAAYERAGLSADAARAAVRLGRMAHAARHYQAAGLHYEAAVCLYKDGKSPLALDELVRVPRDHAAYRNACLLAVRIASERRSLDLATDHFLARYLAAEPRDEHDLDAFDRVARIYEHQGFAENARDVLARVAASRPDFRDAAKRLARLARAAEAAGGVDADKAREDLAFLARPARRPTPAAATALPELPDLPPPPKRSGVSPRPPALGPPPRAPSSSEVRAVGDATVPVGPAPAPPAADASAVGPGSLVAGRYRVEKQIGEGGMATVYKAVDLELGEAVALKLFHSDDPQLLARFKQEVALSRQLGHPNVIRLYDIGAQGRTRFLTMELLEGRALDACVGSPMDPASAVKVLLHACAGLGAAHARGIVHRDVKPANFFLTNAGVLKLMDFGIAKRQSADAGLTVAGFIAGTPHYMAPEQIANFAKATALSDLYSVGVMAFELLTGSVPFDHEDLMSLLMMHVKEAAPPLRSRAPRAPASLEAVVAALLAKDPAARPQGCEALARMLRAVLRELTGR